MLVDRSVQYSVENPKNERGIGIIAARGEIVTAATPGSPLGASWPAPADGRGTIRAAMAAVLAAAPDRTELVGGPDASAATNATQPATNSDSDTASQVRRPASRGFKLRIRASEWVEQSERRRESGRPG
jgi:hypothetical protein